MPKLPLPPEPAHLATHSAETRTLHTDQMLWRVHFTTSAHPTAWRSLRHFGPIARCRFDPHQPPPQEQDEGVAYLTLDVPTALAEVFQETRIVNPDLDAPYLTGFLPLRDIALLDLTGAWPVRIGASHAINTGRKDYCRAWARALRAAWPEADGLISSSAMTGHDCVTLFSPAADVFPEEPAFSEPLNHPDLTRDLTAAADEIGYLFL